VRTDACREGTLITVSSSFNVYPRIRTLHALLLLVVARACAAALGLAEAPRELRGSFRTGNHAQLTVVVCKKRRQHSISLFVERLGKELLGPPERAKKYLGI
jgi:hypothetical protein